MSSEALVPEVIERAEVALPAGEGFHFETPFESWLAGKKAASSRTWIKAARRALTTWLYPYWRPRRRGEPMPVSADAAREYAWHSITADVVNVICHRLDQQRVAANTKNQVLTAIGGIVDECEDLELIEPREHRRIKKALKAGREKQSRGAGTALGTDQLEAIFRLCEADEDRARGSRDAALVALALVLRASEVAALRLADVNLATGELDVRGGKARHASHVDEAVVPPTGLPALRRWVAQRGTEPGPFLLEVRGRRIVREPQITRSGPNRVGLSANSVYRRVVKVSGDAGVRIATHDLRRTFATGALENGVKIHTLRRLMRHASIETTTKYDRSDFDRARREVARFTIPCAPDGAGKSES